MKLLLLFLMFLLFGAFFIISNHELALHQTQAREQFFSLYFNWISTLFDRGASITGYIVNADWLPSSNSTSMQ